MTNTKSILVVEDEQAITKALETELIAAGYPVTTVFNGQEAIDRLRKENFDLVLLDILLPQKDGWAVLEEINKVAKNKRVKVLITSNLSQEKDIRKAKQLGAADFMVKSDVTLSHVIARAQELLKD